MPAALLSRDELLARLMELFRAQGYDGASLAQISELTGLGKSSLYHHFPGGKADMAGQVLAHLDEQLRVALLPPLGSDLSPAKKLDHMLDTISAFYGGGSKACLLERLCASVDRETFRRPLARAFAEWIDAVEAVCLEAGQTRATARARAEDLVVRVEGALVVAAGTGDTKVFARTIRDLRKTTLA
jgi:AcrR family transcriptional regulator